jgi:hypothetical protein
MSWSVLRNHDPADQFAATRTRCFPWLMIMRLWDLREYGRANSGKGFNVMDLEREIEGEVRNTAFSRECRRGCRSGETDGSAGD